MVRMPDYSELKKIINDWIGDACDDRDDAYRADEIAAHTSAIEAYKNVLYCIEELEKEYELS